MKAFDKCIAISFVLAIVFLIAPAFADDGKAKSASPQKTKESLLVSKRVLGLQTELLFREEKRIAPENEARPSFSFMRISPEMARYLLYASLIVIAIVIILNLRANLWSSSRSQQMERVMQQESAPNLVALRMEKAQVEADEMARQGNFAEAMHILLLQSVGELRRRLNVPIAVSLTSREILHGTAALTPDGRAILADIIGRVEISYFGTHLPDREEYQACRRSFDALVDILRGGNA